MAFSTGYGDTFLLGTKGGTVVAGWTIEDSGVVNGGAVVMAGNTGVSPITKDMDINTLADNLGDRAVGSKVLGNVGTGGATTDRVGISGVVDSTVNTDGKSIAFNASATQWVIRGVSDTLGGNSNTAIRQFGGTVGDGTYDNIQGTIADRLIGSKADEAFDVMARPSTQIVPGRTKGSNAGNATTMVNPADGTAAVATEIFPTRALPGELTYHFGGLGKPTTDEYKAKDEYES